MMRFTMLISSWLIASAYLAQGAPEIASSSTLSCDIHFGGHHYCPLAMVIRYTDGTVAGSSVLLMPWDERPKFSTSFDAVHGISTFTLSEHEHTFRLAGRYLAITDSKGTWLKLLPGEFEPEDYKDKLSLQAAIINLLTKADKESKTSPK